MFSVKNQYSWVLNIIIKYSEKSIGDDDPSQKNATPEQFMLDLIL